MVRDGELGTISRNNRQLGWNVVGEGGENERLRHDPSSRGKLTRQLLVKPRVLLNILTQSLLSPPPAAVLHKKDSPRSEELT